MNKGFQWTPFVFIRYVLFFSLGILFQIYYLLPVIIWAMGLIVTVFLYSLFYATLDKHRKYIYQYIFGILALVFLFSAGSCLTYYKNKRNKDSDISNLDERIKFFKAKVISEVETKPNSYKTEVQILQTRDSLEWTATSGKIILYQSRKDSLKKLKYGDNILIKGTPIPISVPANPGEFDYRKYLSQHQIFFQLFLRPDSYLIIDNSPANKIINLSLYLRSKSDSILNRHIKGKREYALASALILGVKSGLDNELKQAYSAAGAMHILAVSGMHVALVFTLLTFGLGGIRKIKNGNIYFSVISLAIIWLYAFVTGLSPSVLRATVMFTFIIGGKMFNRSNSIYNNLGISAFCLLIYDPYLILDAGFQLSYLAVFGIVYLYPKVYNLIEVKVWILDKAWEFTAMSLVAQLATFPLSLYYFHQFPTYFLFSNLILIPVSIVILYGGVALLFVCWVPGLNSLLGIALREMVWFMNQVVFKTEMLPNSILSGFDISLVETGLLYIAIICILILFYTRKLAYLKIACASVMAISALQLLENVKIINQKRLIVYKVNKHSAIEFQNGNVSHLVCDSLLLKDKSALNYSIIPAQTKFGISNAHYRGESQEFLPVSYFKEMKLIRWQEKTVLLIDKPIEKTFGFRKTIPVDLIIVQHDGVKSIHQIQKLFTGKRIVLDSSVKPWVANTVLANVNNTISPIHSVALSGAYVWEL